MLKVVPLHEDLIQATVDEITNNSLNNFSDFLVVSPSKRFLFFLKEALNKKINKSYFPPELLTIDQLVFKLFELNWPGFKMINEIEAILQTYKTVKDVFKETVYAGGKISQNFPDFFPWSWVIHKAIEELMVEGGRIDDIDEKIFEEFAKLGEYHSGYKNFISKLPTVIGGFKKTLFEQKRYTRGISYRMVGELAEKGSLEIPPGKEFIFSGMGGLNVSEEKLMKFIFDSSRARLLIRSDRAGLNDMNSPFFLQRQALKDLNLSWENDQGKISWNRFAGKVNLYCLSDMESQMLQVAEILEGAMQSKKSLEELKKIAVILPESATLIPFIHGVVSRLSSREKRFPFNITLGYPFVRTPLYQMIRFIIKTAESREHGEVFFRDYLNLVRHPYVKLSSESHDEDEPLKRGIHLVEEIISQENLIYFSPDYIEDKVIEKLKRATEIPSDLNEKIVFEIKNLHTTFLTGKDLSLEELGTFLKRSVLTLEKNKKFHLFLGEYINTAVRALDCVIQFAKDNEAEVSFADFSSLTSLITHYFCETHIYFEGSPLKGIQVMGMLESRGLGFDEVILLDVVEGILPQRLKYDPLLPYDIRKTLGIRSYTEWESLFSFNFFSLIGSAKKVHLLWADNQGDADKTEKSRFVERIFFEMEKEGHPYPGVVRNSCPINIRSIELKKVRKTEAIRDKIRQMIFSPSALEMYIQCPLRFYFSRILGLKEKEEISADPDVGELGTLIHRVLEMFYRKLDFSLDSEQTENQLKDILKMEFDNRGFNISSGIARIRFWVLKEKLSDFIREDIQRLKNGKIQLKGIEEKISADFSFPFSQGSISIRGRIDRIEKERDVIRLIDYKTGSPFPARVNPRMKAFYLRDIHTLSKPEYLNVLKEIHRIYGVFQIFLYTLLYKRHLKIDYNTIDAAYIFLKPAEDFFRPVFVQGNKKEQISAEDKQDLLENFFHILTKIFADIYQREEFIANPQDDRYCSYCPFKIPCGNF